MRLAKTEPACGPLTVGYHGCLKGTSSTGDELITIGKERSSTWQIAVGLLIIFGMFAGVFPGFICLLCIFGKVISVMGF